MKRSHVKDSVANGTQLFNEVNSKLKLDGYQGPGIGVRPVPSFPTYQSRPKFSNVGRSTPGAGPVYWEPLETFGTVGPLDLRM